MAYLTQEQRKEKCSDYFERFEFHYVRDLSEPVVVICRLEDKIRLASAITQFIGMWMINTWDKLNGFSGLSTIRYEFREKE